MALALGEDRDEHVGAGHFLATGRLDMDHGALDDALEPGRRLRILLGAMGEIGEFGVDIVDQAALQHVEIDIAGAHHGGRVLILDQGEQQMFEGRVFLVALVRESEGLVKCLFEAAGE